MAKQSVTFVERHVEKIVLGVAGGALLVIGALYLASSPHKIELSGESVGPQELYARIRQRAENARIQMQNKKPDPEGAGNIRVPKLDEQLSPYEDLQLPTELNIAFVPLHPPVPVVEASDQRGRIQLAEILPPSPIVATTGRAYAGLPSPEPMTGAERPERLEDAVTQDWHWVAVFAAVHRADQRELFVQADYSTNRRKLIVAGVEAERQEWLPENQWSPARTVTGYAPEFIPVRKEVDIEQTGQGVSTEDLQVLYAYRDQLQENQSAVLRPTFQQMLPFPLDWEVPELTGVQVDLTRYAMVSITDSLPNAQPPEQDVEPVWLNDLSVEPGKLYRYRLRLLGFNTYVGNVSDLANRQDAGKVVVEGQWSEWSAPVRVEADRHLFVNPPARRAENAVRVELHMWSEGDWLRISEHFTVGEPLIFRHGREEYQSEAVVGALVLDRPYRERSYRLGEIRVRDVSTVSAVLIGVDGAVAEHIAARDADRRNKLILRDRERQRLMEEYKNRAGRPQAPSARMGEGGGAETGNPSPDS